MRAVIVIDAADQENANDVALANFDPVGGGGTFHVGLVPIGSAAGIVATNYITSADFSDAFWAEFQTFAAQFPTAKWKTYDLGSSPNTPQAFITSLGLKFQSTVIA